MSHKKNYRIDKTCLNCKFVVEQKFCPNCGQENIDTRKSFHHLFFHFFEDLTHYENAFWRTIKNLLFKPAALTKEYLSGKRLSFLAPVRLYIFISFLTFFILSMVPDLGIVKFDKTKKAFTEKTSGTKNDYENYDYQADTIKEKSTEKIKQKDTLSSTEKEFNEILKSKKISDSAKLKLKEILATEKKEKFDKENFYFGYSDTITLNKDKAAGKINASTYWFIKKVIRVKENNTSEEILEKGLESAKHNFPKVLLIYMPIFAFFLWIFHNKKRWYYFDHGIFTLHYFSFLLLIYLLIFGCSQILGLFETNIVAKIAKGIIGIVGFIWMFYYFFPAHHRFYGESRRKSFLKTMFLFFINIFIILILLVFFFLYTIINIK